MLSEMLAPLFGCHQEFMLDGFGGWWSFRMKCQLQVFDDPIDNFMISNESNEFYLTSTQIKDQWTHFIDLAYILIKREIRRKRELKNKPNSQNCTFSFATKVYISILTLINSDYIKSLTNNLFSLF